MADPWAILISFCDSHQPEIVLAICAVALLNFIVGMITLIRARRLAKKLIAIESSIVLMLRVEEKRLLDEAHRFPKVMVLPPILRTKRSDVETAAGVAAAGRRVEAKEAVLTR